MTTQSFRYIGTTDETTVCEHCGREDLRSTVVLALLDVDGNEEEYVRYGSTCAARALAIRGGGSAVRHAAQYAQLATLRDARDAHQRAEMHAQHAYFDETGTLAWLRPALLDNAAAGVETAVKRVAAIQALAGPIADGAAIGYPTRGAIERKLRRDGWL
jgi:hypothetical protein